MEYRLVQESDYEQLVALQEATLVSNLSDAEKADGFLSRTFTAEELKAMDTDLCIVVCENNGSVQGFLATGTLEYNGQFDLPSTMIARFNQVNYEDKLLSAWASFIAGPVAIDKSARGTGAFQGMYHELFRIIPEKYDLATTLISTVNTRSLRAHEKIGYESVDGFNWNNRDYIILVRKVRQSPF
jgi:hypothetical protein